MQFALSFAARRPLLATRYQHNITVLILVSSAGGTLEKSALFMGTCNVGLAVYFSSVTVLSHAGKVVLESMKKPEIRPQPSENARTDGHRNLRR